MEVNVGGVVIFIVVVVVAVVAVVVVLLYVDVGIVNIKVVVVVVTVVVVAAVASVVVVYVVVFSIYTVKMSWSPLKQHQKQQHFLRSLQFTGLNEGHKLDWCGLEKSLWKILPYLGILKLCDNDRLLQDL